MGKLVGRPAQQGVGCISPLGDRRVLANQRLTQPSYHRVQANTGFCGNSKDGGTKLLRQTFIVKAQPVAGDDIGHIGQHRNGFVMPLAFANHLQGEIETFLEPRRVNNT